MPLPGSVEEQYRDTDAPQARWLQMLILNGQHPDTNVTIVPAGVIHEVAKGVMVYDGFACVQSLCLLRAKLAPSQRGTRTVANGVRRRADSVVLPRAWCVPHRVLHCNPH